MCAADDIDLIEKLPIEAAAKTGCAGVKACEAVADGWECVSRDDRREAQFCWPAAAEATDHEGEVTAGCADAQLIDDGG